MGDSVTAEGHIVYGHCMQCRLGDAHLCRRTQIIGVDRDGAFADYIAMPASNVMKLDGIPSEIGAIIAVATACLISLRLASRIDRLLGITGNLVATRLLGVVLAALAVQYVIDGVNITNSGYGAIGSYSIVFGSLGSGVPFDFIEEVQVKSGGVVRTGVFNAEVSP